MRWITALVAALVASVLPVMAVTNTTATQFDCRASVNFGLSQYATIPMFSYAEPTASTALFNSSQIIVVPPATTDQAINLPTLFPFLNTALVVSVQDISSPGQATAIGLASGGSRLPLAARGFILSRVSGTVPVLYIDNASSTTSAILKVTVLGN